jgi:hypothetical protein
MAKECHNKGDSASIIFLVIRQIEDFSRNTAMASGFLWTHLLYRRPCPHGSARPSAAGRGVLENRRSLSASGKRQAASGKRQAASGKKKQNIAEIGRLSASRSFFSLSGVGAIGRFAHHVCA